MQSVVKTLHVLLFWILIWLMENYYLELPENYNQVYFIDAKDNKKTVTLISIGSLVLTFLVAYVCFLFIDLSVLKSVLDRDNLLVPYLIFLASMFVYIVLHELVHGAAYKALTHQKLTFGFTLAVAFCGVPNIYTSRKTAMISLIAPFAVFTALFIPAMVVCYNINLMYYVFVALLFSIHFGGCIGDLYMFVLLLFKYKQKELLMRDTGPAQTLYLPSDMC